ncbi:SEC-C metal-binding domain-containing protein [Virgibacillus byunsanensis]|uniref:SEC-C metal-binding domain-containing protein n=1 Tax=Virgibacillus byunsanensis TaxID=570945 RepID=A0ABW3LK73_9BACI
MNLDELLVDEEFEKNYFEKLKCTLDAFAADLYENQGLKMETINHHTGRLELFAEFLYHQDVKLQEIHADYIIDFLGDYYIRKVLNSKHSDIAPYLTLFKKFAKYAYENEYINKKVFDEIKMVCKQKQFFLHRFDTYFSSSDLEEWYFNNDLYQYLEEIEDVYSLADEEKLDIDTNFVQLLKEKNVEAPTAVIAFSSFLKKIQSEKNVKLTSMRQNITRNFWKQLDELLNLQLFSKPTLNQEDIGLYHYFYLLGIQLKLFRITGNKIIPTELLKHYQELSHEEKFVLMIGGLWNQLSWHEIQPSNVGGRIEVTQARRSNLADVLSQFPVGEKIILSEDQLGILLINQTFMGGLLDASDEFIKHILPIMEYFGLFHLEYELKERKYENYYEIVSIELNQLGYFTCNQLKNMGNTIPENAPSNSISDLFIQMGPNLPVVNQKVGRNDPCPCGSGKKYKRCCI